MVSASQEASVLASFTCWRRSPFATGGEHQDRVPISDLMTRKRNALSRAGHFHCLDLKHE
jgi:hypothetical protein